MTYRPIYACAVLHEDHIKMVVENYGRENIHFVPLWEGFNFTESQFIFSYTVSKFQHLMNL